MHPICDLNIPSSYLFDSEPRSSFISFSNTPTTEPISTTSIVLPSLFSTEKAISEFSSVSTISTASSEQNEERHEIVWTEKNDEALITLAYEIFQKKPESTPIKKAFENVKLNGILPYPNALYTRILYLRKTGRIQADPPPCKRKNRSHKEKPPKINKLSTSANENSLIWSSSEKQELMNWVIEKRYKLALKRNEDLSISNLINTKGIYTRKFFANYPEELNPLERKKYRIYRKFLEIKKDEAFKDSFTNFISSLDKNPKIAVSLPSINQNEPSLQIEDEHKAGGNRLYSRWKSAVMKAFKEYTKSITSEDELKKKINGASQVFLGGEMIKSKAIIDKYNSLSKRRLRAKPLFVTAMPAIVLKTHLTTSSSTSFLEESPSQNKKRPINESSTATQDAPSITTSNKRSRIKKNFPITLDSPEIFEMTVPSSAPISAIQNDQTFDEWLQVFWNSAGPLHECLSPTATV